MGDTIVIETPVATVLEVAGMQGPQGPQGIPGVGVPTGGSTGQVLRKASSADYATEWAAAGSGSGSVTSVALASSDFTISGSPITDAGTITANLGNTGVTAGTYTKVTVDAKGRVTTGATATATDVGAAATTHAVEHATSGSDPISPSSIGAQSLFTTTTNPITGNTTITAGRALIFQVLTSSAVTADISLPSSGHQTGDVIIVRSTTPFTAGTTLTIKSGTGALLDTITAQNQAYRYTASSSSPNGWSKVLVDTHAHAAADVTSGVLDNARVNFAAPDAIGSTTRNTGAFTTLNATNGTITASAPVLDLSQTWNNAAVTFTGIRANITDTASAAASNLLDLQTGGTTAMRVDRTGRVIIAAGGSAGANAGAISIGSGGAGFYQRVAGSLTFSGGNIELGSTALTLTTILRFGANMSTVDSSLVREAADTLALRGNTTTNPQSFRIYNTTDTGLTNYERGFMRWSSNVLQIGTEKAGTGSARALEFQTDGVTRYTIGTTGIFSSQNSRIVFDETNTVAHFGNTPRFSVYYSNNQYVAIGGGTGLRFASGRSDQAGTANLELIRDADAVLAQRAGTTAQTFRIYNTWTNATTFERANFRWATNEFIIDAEAGSGGGTLRGIKIGSATSSLLGFYGATPVDRPDTVSDAATQDLTGSDTLDKTKVEADLTSCKTAINAVIDRLQELGLIA